MVHSPVITTEAGGAQGGVGLVVWERQKRWSVESTRFHGTTVVICEVVAGRKWTQLIGVDLPTSTLEQLLHLEEALTRFQNHNPIVLGDLNAKIGQSQNPRRQQVDDLLMDFGLVHLLHHFRQRWQLRHIMTWSQVQGVYSCGQDTITSWGRIGANLRLWELGTCGIPHQIISHFRPDFYSD